MYSALDRTFHVLFPHRFHGVLAHIKAEEVINNLHVSKIGEKLALLCLCEIVNNVGFPDLEKQTECVRKAEEKLPELLGVNPDHEFHMAEVEIIHNLLKSGSSFADIEKMYKNKIPPR